jgi:DNA primase
VYSESNRSEISYPLCQDEATLVAMVNLGGTEINPWSSTSRISKSPTTP